MIGRQLARLASLPQRFVYFIQHPEVIGADECPILLRWTLLEFGPRTEEGSGPTRRYKLLLHHFQPKADERDYHDHPRGFLTVVLKGGYDDLEPCARCRGRGREQGEHGMGCGPTCDRGHWRNERCGRCDGRGHKPHDQLKAGSVRYRPAKHTHRTRVHAGGAWTLVLMGPIKRPWGFWPDGRWMPWREYAAEYGPGMRCT